MSKKDIRDAVIFSAIFTVFSAIAKKLLKPNAKIADDDTGAKADLYIGEKGYFATDKTNKDSDFLSSLNLFFHIHYTVTNIMLTIRMFSKSRDK